MSDLPAFRRLHRLWLVFVVIVVAILAVLPWLDAEPSDIPPVLPATLAAAAGLGAFVAIVAIDLTFAASPPANDTRALHEFEARATLGFAIAQAPAVLGFALAWAFGRLLPAAIGVGLAAACLLRARPSDARLERLETAWSDAGKDVSARRAAKRAVTSTQPPDRSTPDEGEDREEEDRDQPPDPRASD